MSSDLLDNHVNLFKQLPEDGQLQLIEGASNEVGDQVVIPTDSNEQFRVQKYTELLRNLPEDSQRNFITNVEMALAASKCLLFKMNTNDWRPVPQPPPPPGGPNIDGVRGSGDPPPPGAPESPDTDGAGGKG